MDSEAQMTLSENMKNPFLRILNKVRNVEKSSDLVFNQLLDTFFYKSVYGSVLGRNSPLSHFIKNYKSLKYDPCPDISLKYICKSNPYLLIDEIIDRLVSDKDFYQASRTVSEAVFEYFGLNNYERKIKEVKVLSKIVDNDYYLNENPDVGSSWMPPYIHYALFGADECRKPTSWFDTLFYIKEYKDVKEGSVNPLWHYHKLGKVDGRFPNCDEKDRHNERLAREQYIRERTTFDIEYYHDNNPDVKEAGIDPVEHYFEFGEEEGRRPNKFFCPKFYRYKNKDVRDLGISPFQHYVEFGIYENRESISEDDNIINKKDEENLPNDVPHLELEFDENYYFENNPDVAGSGIDPYQHYISDGEREGRCPNKYFSPMFYLKLNADVRQANMLAFEHYCKAGFFEGRLGKSVEKKERSRIKRPLLFVGHDGIQAGSQTVLLEVIKWFYSHTIRPLKVLLLSPGPMADLYAAYADIYVLPEYKVDDVETLEQYLKNDFEFIYINTVVGGHFFTLLRKHNLKVSGEVVSHIHEMENVIAENASKMRELQKVTHHWISASPSTTETLCNNCKIEDSKISTVPAFIKPVGRLEDTGSGLKWKARSELGLDESAFVVAGCGTVYWRKGPELFVDAARKVLGQTDRECQFVWIGSGPDFETIKSGLTEYELETIKFVGERSDANTMLAAADIFFLSSREDPFPLVVMESAQHGVPAVCFAEATGITAFIQKDAGICLDSIDSGKASDAILALMNDPDLQESLSRCAKKRVFDNYTSDKQCLNIYNVIAKHTSYKPSVSVVVPFYNHERFVKSRIDSILGQTIKDIEVILIDDSSVDNTVQMFEPYLEDRRLYSYINSANSGSAFKQWRTGTHLAGSDIVWIAEGDDACNLDMLEILLLEMDDPLVNIASGRTEIINDHGELVDGELDPYLERAYPKKFCTSYKRDGVVEVNENLGAMCTLVNASGLLLRKYAIINALEKASEFKMCGDWYVYLNAIRRGKIVYRHDAINYFRRHSASVVHQVEGTPQYFNERYRIAKYAVENFYCSPNLIRRIYESIDFEWDRFKYKNKGRKLEEMFDKQEILDAQISKGIKSHVGFYVHGMLFSNGGIERLATDLANELVCRGYKVTIFCRVWGNQEPIYPLMDSVRLIPCFNESNIGPSIRKLKSLLRDDQIDIFIPMLSEWLFEPITAAAQDTGIPVIVSEHNDPDKIVELWWDKDKRIETFSKADCIHLILDKFKESLPAHLQEKVTIIPNSIRTLPPVTKKVKRENVIISVGRLVEQKRMDRLIKAFAQIFDRYPDWQVHIYGDGHLRDELQLLINELGVTNQVTMKGRVDNIVDYYRSASIFVLPSEFEAFGIVVAEAQQASLPCIAYKGCNGPNELICDRRNGLLVDDCDESTAVDSLAQFVEQLILSPDLRDIYGEQAVKSTKKFEIEKICRQWENLIENYLPK